MTERRANGTTRTCSSCGADPGSSLACLQCGRLQEEGPETNHFARLGADPSQPFDAAAAESRYLQLSRLLHPDFQTSAGDEEQQRALRYSAQLNEAWRVLNNEQLRAEHLLELRDPGALDRHKQLTPEFLMEAMSLSEELEEAHATGCTDTVSRIAQETRAEIDKRMRGVAQACLQTIQRIAQEAHADPGRPRTGGDAADGVDHAWDSAMIATLLHQARVFRRILRDTEREP